MKKALLCGLSAALLLALVLVACNKPQADQPDPPPTPSAVQTQPEETSEPVNQVEKMSVNTTQQEADTRRLPTEEELLEWFQMSYDFGQIFANAGYSEEEILEEELFRLNGFMEIMDDFRMPDDLEVQYLTWRVLNHSQKPATEAPASNPQINNNQTELVNAETGGSGGTTQNNTGTGGTGGTGGPGGTGGGLAVDVTGGKSPMDFMNREDIGTEARDSGAFVDMSKVGFGN